MRHAEQCGALTITIWPLSVSPRTLSAMYVMLSADEQRHAHAMRMPAIEQQFIVSRSVTRMLLAEHCGCAAGQLVLEADIRGKPHLRCPGRATAFNLSHSAGFCALAIGEADNLGLDIESVHPSVGDLASTMFTPGEARRFAQVPTVARLQALFRAWVAKEAYLKATGDGLGGGLESLELDFEATSHVQPVAIRGSRAEVAQWHFHSFDVNAYIVGAVATKGGGSNIEVRLRHIDVDGDARLQHARRSAVMEVLS